ncbi:MAG: PhzF family phenazine biosynthesis protein [Alphaproteobacteria bacterium]|nr:PhzF family phenazine biosynthesis protein [Alphaproteobacteria bacterium]
MSNIVMPAQNSVTVNIVNAFVKDGAGGNPAGVVLDADGLDESAMQRIAAAAGLSETAFVSTSATEAFKLDFFTPTRRIAHCGHATIGTFSILAARGRVIEGATSKETVDGPRAIEIIGGAAYMERLAPKYSDPKDWDGVTKEAVLASLGLSTDSLVEGGAPVVVDTGNRFLLVGVTDAATLAAIEPDQAAIEAISDRLDLIGFYVFTPVRDGTVAATTRMFAPRYGIAEESATGMAAGPLGCLLFDRFGVKGPWMDIEQGTLMTPSSPSLLNVRLQIADGAVAGLMVGGFGRIVEERTVTF